MVILVIRYLLGLGIYLVVSLKVSYGPIILWARAFIGSAVASLIICALFVPSFPTNYHVRRSLLSFLGV